ncbi:hypothetical protein [Bifidobacterium biavatii]|uniref:Uncharacterized protein n=1 Tax=Bifidobacterium biavatii DSM 23969 TaxID=1437608 RepID=A0A087A1Y6_9BIFI|nr:hypothetical protein [Bifidobacterium biavatii]KFI52786.1 hypothetical protein BBIA_0472 [Bifidobacterium biavatii DSM 23969]
MVRQQSHVSRQFVAMAKRCAILYAVMFAVPLATLGVSAYRVYVQLSEPGSAVLPVDVEARMFPFLFLAGVVWFVGFFDVELCHGVSRRSFANIGMIAAVAISVVATIVLAPMSHAGSVLARSALASEAQSDSLLNSPAGTLLYLQATRSDRFRYAGAGCPAEWIGGVCGITSDHRIVAFDWLYMSMKMFSLMLIVSSLGMLVGALVAWVFNGGVMRWTGGSILIIVAVALYTVLNPWWYYGDMYDGALPKSLYWIHNLLSGSVIRTEGARRIVSYQAWIPLVFSILLFALCAFAVDRMTLRREIRPARGR